MVSITDVVAGYLDLGINPSTRRAGMPSTTKLDLLVLGLAASRDSFGNLRRRFVETVMREPDVAWIRLHPDSSLVLVRHAPGRSLEVLALIYTDPNSDVQRLNFYWIIEEVLQETFRDFAYERA